LVKVIIQTIFKRVLTLALTFRPLPQERKSPANDLGNWQAFLPKKLFLEPTKSQKQEFRLKPAFSKSQTPSSGICASSSPAETHQKPRQKTGPPQGTGGMGSARLWRAFIGVPPIKCSLHTNGLTQVRA